MNEGRTRDGGALYLLIAVALALGIWFYVDEYGNNGSAYLTKMEIRDIPIEYLGKEQLADKGLMLLSDGTTESVDLTFEGPRLLAVQLDRSKIRLTVDLTGITSAGTQTLRYNRAYLNEEGRATLTANQKYAKLAVTVSRDSVESATVNVGEMSHKTVDVRCELIGKVADGCSAGEIRLSQDTIDVQGQEEELQNIAYAKVSLILGDAAMETVTQSLACQLCDASGEPLDAENFYLKTKQITATLPIYMTKTLPLTVTFITGDKVRESDVNYVIRPESVTVSGEASVLKDVDEINLGTMSLPDLIGSGARTFHTYAIIAPEGCANQSGVSTATLEITFKDMATKTVTTTNIIPGNDIPAGKTVVIETESLEVQIYGPAQSVQSVTGDDIQVTPDLDDFASASGSYAVPAEITVPGYRKVGVRGEYQIQALITDAAPGSGAAS
ncbi:MAG: hypothetical protein IKN96_03290 [Oscillibacter sp.]|nr:hypothetical protein [Oscillibacter sp.]